MGRDRKRVLVCAAVSLVLILAGTLGMDWYRVAFDAPNDLGRIAVAIDLQSLHTCTAVRVCTTAPLTPLPGMFPTLAAVTLWSCLAFAALVAFQAGVRLLTGNANDAIAKFGYMFALTAISIAFATAYLFGPETEGSAVGMAAELGLSLHRTWAPATLIGGLIAGFATLYISVAPETGDLGDSYKPVTIVTVLPISDEGTTRPGVAVPLAARAATRPLRPGARPATVPPVLGDGTDPATASGTGTVSLATGPTPMMTRIGSGAPVQPRPTPKPTTPSPARPTTGQAPRIGPSTVTSEIQIARDLADESAQPTQRRRQVTPGAAITRRETSPGAASGPASGPAIVRRETTPGPASGPASGPAIVRRETTPQPPTAKRESAGVIPTPRREITGVGIVPTPKREITGVSIVPTPKRETTGVIPTPKRETTGVMSAARRETTGQMAAAGLSKSGPIPRLPEHLRNRLRYVAITAELSGGGIDARREDGTSRLVLWRDVVGVVVRRLPPDLDSAIFVDIVSTAGSTLRILPWTRVTGEPLDGEPDERPRFLVEHILAKCPAARLDPATRQFLDTDEVAQLRDADTLNAHDARLA